MKILTTFGVLVLACVAVGAGDPTPTGSVLDGVFSKVTHDPGLTALLGAALGWFSNHFYNKRKAKG